MGFFSRLKAIFTGKLEDIAAGDSTIQDQLRIMIDEMEESVARATSALGQAIAGMRKIERQLELSQERIKSLELEATDAVQNGDEDKARELLKQQAKQEKVAANYKEMLSQSNETVSALEGRLSDLKLKLDKAIQQESMLIARGAQAEADADVARKEAGLDDYNFENFNVLEEKVHELEAQREAFDENSLDAEIERALELEDPEEMNRRLDELRNRE